MVIGNEAIAGIRAVILPSLGISTKAPIARLVRVGPYVDVLLMDGLVSKAVQANGRCIGLSDVLVVSEVFTAVIPTLQAAASALIIALAVGSGSVGSFLAVVIAFGCEQSAGV